MIQDKAKKRNYQDLTPARYPDIFKGDKNLADIDNDRMVDVGAFQPS
jgi:hypothetical protein